MGTIVSCDERQDIDLLREQEPNYVLFVQTFLTNYLASICFDIFDALLLHLLNPCDARKLQNMG